MGAVLNNQLQSVMQEGLLDSLLPYLVRDKKLYKVHSKLFQIIFKKFLHQLASRPEFGEWLSWRILPSISIDQTRRHEAETELNLETLERDDQGGEATKDSDREQQRDHNTRVWWD